MSFPRRSKITKYYGYVNGDNLNRDRKISAKFYDQSLAGNRNFWPIFGGRIEIIIFWPEKNFFMIRPKFLPSGHI